MLSHFSRFQATDICVTVYQVWIGVLTYYGLWSIDKRTFETPFPEHAGNLASLTATTDHFKFS